MRIKYDFEDEYKDIELGEKLDRLLSFPKKKIELLLRNIKTEMEAEEATNDEAHILLYGIKEDDPGVGIFDYSAEMKIKIREILTEDEMIAIIMDLDELLPYFK